MYALHICAVFTKCELHTHTRAHALTILDRLLSDLAGDMTWLFIGKNSLLTSQCSCRCLVVPSCGATASRRWFWVCRWPCAGASALPVSPSATSGSTCRACAATTSNCCVCDACGRSYWALSLVPVMKPWVAVSVASISASRVNDEEKSSCGDGGGEGRGQLESPVWISQSEATWWESREILQEFQTGSVAIFVWAPLYHE